MKHVNRKIFLKTHTHTNTVAKLWLFQTTQKTNEAKRTNLAHRLSHNLTHSHNHGPPHGCSNWFNFKFLPSPPCFNPTGSCWRMRINKGPPTPTLLRTRRSKRAPFQPFSQLQVDTKWENLNPTTHWRRWWPLLRSDRNCNARERTEQKICLYANRVC